MTKLHNNNKKIIEHISHLHYDAFRYKFRNRCCKWNPMIYVLTLYKSREKSVTDCVIADVLCDMSSNRWIPIKIFFIL